MSTCPFKLGRGTSPYHLAEQATTLQEGEDILFKAYPELMYTNPSARAIFHERWYKNYVSELEEAVNEYYDDSSSSVSSSSGSCTSSSSSSSSSCTSGSSRSSASSCTSGSSSSSCISGSSRSSASSRSSVQSSTASTSSSSSRSSASSSSGTLSSHSSSSGESLLSLHLKRKQVLRKEPRRMTRSPLGLSSQAATQQKEEKKKDVAEWVNSNCRVNASAVADLVLGCNSADNSVPTLGAKQGSCPVTCCPLASATPSVQKCATDTTIPKFLDGQKDKFNEIFTQLKDSLNKEAAKTGVPPKQTAEEMVSGVVSDIAGHFFKPFFGDTLDLLAGISKTTRSEAEASTSTTSSTTTAPPAEPAPNDAAGENCRKKPVVQSHTIDLNEPFANRNESAARLIASSCIAAKKTCVWESGKPIWVENLRNPRHLLSAYDLHCKTPALMFTVADLEKFDSTIHDGIIFCDNVFLGKQYKPLMSISKKKDILVKVPLEVSTSAYTMVRIPHNIPRIFAISLKTNVPNKKKLHKKCCVVNVDPYHVDMASTLKGLFSSSSAATAPPPLSLSFGPVLPFLSTLFGGMTATSKSDHETNSPAPSAAPTSATAATTTTTTTTTVPAFDPPSYSAEPDAPCAAEDEDFTVDNGLLTATITATLPILPNDNTEETTSTTDNN